MMQNQFITVNPGLVPYDESNFASWSLRKDGQSSTRRLQIEMRRQEDFIADMLGWSEYDAGDDTLTRYPPEYHPRFREHFAMEVHFVRETGPPSDSGPGGSLDYAECEVEVVYEATPGVRWLPNESKPAGVTDERWRYCKFQTQAGYSIQPLPTGILAYNEDDRVIPEHTGQVVQSRTRRVWWYQIPGIVQDSSGPALPGRLQQTIDETCAKMNSDTFLGCPPKTLICLDPEIDYHTMANGKLAADILYSFQQRGGLPDISGAVSTLRTDRPDFTRIIRSDGQYGRVYRTSDPTKVQSIYGSVPFSRLFKFD